ARGGGGDVLARPDPQPRTCGRRGHGRRDRAARLRASDGEAAGPGRARAARGRGAPGRPGRASGRASRHAAGRARRHARRRRAGDERRPARARGRRHPAPLVRARGRAAQRRLHRDDGGRVTTAAGVGRQPRGRLWLVVLQQELRDLWLGGRGLALSLAFGVLLSIVAYLVATNRGLNFLEHRETVNLTLQVAVAVGTLLTLLAGADAISGERERGTLESLLTAPVPRLELVAGKLVASLSLWAAAFAITLPYVWFLGRGVGIVADSIVTGAAVGTLLALALASLGLLVSLAAASNRVSLSLGLFLLLALFTPTQLPAGAQSGWLGDLLLRSDPITAGEHYVGKIVVDGHGWSEDLSWLLSPAVAAVVLSAACLVCGSRLLTLRGGRSR